MRKLTALSLAFILLASSLLVIGPGTMNAEASSSITVYGNTNDGTISKAGAAYGSWTSTIVDADSTTANCTSSNDAVKSLDRTYLSFDTSSIPDDAHVLTAKLWVRCQYGDPSMPDVKIYQGDWGVTLDAADWGCGVSSGTYLGTILGVSNTWFAVDVTTSLVSLIGTTQFEMALSVETAGNRSATFYTTEAASGSRPYMVVTYTTAETITYVMDGGAIHTSEIFPQSSNYNETHYLATFTFDTWSGVADVIIPIPTGWTFQSFSPWSNYSATASELRIWDIRDGATYHVYFTYQVNTMTQVHIGTYVAATGEGLPFESFKVRYCSGSTYNATTAQEIISPDFEVPYGSIYTVAVLDYFGNTIATQGFIANSPNKYVSIPLDIYSFKTYNQQEDFSRFRIYYNNTGAALTYYCAPQETVERFLRPGPYTIVVTQYPDGVASTSEYFNITVSDAEFVKLNGTTISRVISDVAGVKAMQQVLTSLVTPDMVFIRENLPSVPTEAVEYIHPWSVLTATREDNASGTSMALWLPRPDEAGTTYTIISDKLYVSGVFATDIWVNSTAGASLYSAENLPSVITLAGENITVEASAAISVHRETTWRSEDLFYWEYFTTQKLYRVTLAVNNSMADNLTDLGWFVGWAENRSIDLSSVRVYDVDNAVDLVAGLNYDVTTAGLRMHFDSLAPASSRTFTITCYDANSTSGQSVPMIYCSEKVESSWDSQEYWLSRASWTSTYAATYEGQLNIKLDVTGAEFIDPTTVVIVDTASNKILGAEEFFISGNVITIQHVIVPQGGVKNYDVYYKMDFDGSAGWNPWEPLQIVDGVPISWGFIMVFVVIILLSLTLVDRLKFGSWSTIRASMTIAAASIVTLVLTSGGL
jgi:hypothetical protein